MIVVDTNVWSEALRLEPNPTVRDWARLHEPGLFLSAIVLAELRGGAAMLPSGQRRLAMEAHFDALEADYADRILPFDQTTATRYGKVLETARRAGKPIATADAMIAATALRHGMAVATRDRNDFAGAGVALIDPWG